MTLDETLQIAVQHHQAGQLGEAEKHYQQILAQQPDHPDALHLLGVIAAQTARRESAIELINKAIAARPNAREFHSNLGHVLRESRRLEEAAAAYRRAIEIKPDSVDDYQHLGITLSQLGQLDGAINAHRQAFRLKPDSPQALELFRGSLSAGIAACRQDVQRNPGDVEAHFKLGRLLREIGDTAGALAAFGAALRIDPNRPDIESEVGVALDLNGEFDKAIAAHHRALRLDPNFADAHFNLAHAYSETGRFDDSVASYAEAARLKPDWADAHWNFSLALLLRGDYMRGWAEYEWRWHLPGSPSITHNVAQPMWDGRDLTGTTILLRPEQGFGDTIQFIRYAPLVARRGARLLLTSQPELSRLLQRVTEIEQVPSGQLQFDLHCPLMRLPLIFGTTLDSIPANIPYLQADVGLVAAWGRKLGTGNGRLKVGLTWAGLPESSKRPQSLDDAGDVGAAGGRARVDFYSLQKGPAAAQVKTPPPGMRSIDFTVDIKDFADTAAIMSHLDLVIAIDTSVVHLAGAMGIPVWTMIPFKPDWRWLIEREDSPWYPTMRLFRQKSRGAWGEVIERVRFALLNFGPTLQR